MKPSPPSKHRAYRARTKAKALTMMGGQCERCGFDDARALRLHHDKPVRRTRNGMAKNAMTSTESHRAVVRGKARGLRLLCANCSVIDSARDWQANVNVKRTAER